MSISVVSAAAVLHVDRTTERILQANIALGAVAPTPVRARAAEAVLRGQRISRHRIRQAAAAAIPAATPIDDVRATAAYRRDVIPAIVENALLKALESAE
jgi:carbon-monoxide dehydrogenase medium subunit